MKSKCAFSSSSSDVGVCHYNRRYWLPTLGDPEKRDDLERGPMFCQYVEILPSHMPPPWALSCPWLPISQRAKHPVVLATVYSAWRKLSRQCLSLLANRVLLFFFFYLILRCWIDWLHYVCSPRYLRSQTKQQHTILAQKRLAKCIYPEDKTLPIVRAFENKFAFISYTFI